MTSIAKSRVLQSILRGLIWIVGACLLAWIFKATLFSLYRVSSVSMRPTFEKGDYVVVNHASYRLRSPETYPLSSIPFPSFSIPLWDVQRGEIVVFKPPLRAYQAAHPSRIPNYMKQCVAVPGDTVVIDARAEQIIVRKGTKAPSTSRIRRFDVPHTSSRTQQRWVVPSRGDTLDLQRRPLEPRLRIIRRDGHQTSVSNGQVHINGQMRERYIVNQDYYFVLGDNLSQSRDSRHWGLVPHQNLVGHSLTSVW